MLGITSCSAHFLFGQLANPQLGFRHGEKTSAVFAGDFAVSQIQFAIDRLSPPNHVHAVAVGALALNAQDVQLVV